MEKRSFDNLMLVGRGGSGKSELVDFLDQIDNEERLTKYHIGKYEIMDDFPWLHSMFKDEDIWEALGIPRRFSKKISNVYASTDDIVYSFMILKFNAEIGDLLAKNPKFYDKTTLLMEFARGGKNTYKKSFDLFSEDILKRTAIFYMDNTFEESLRRNEVRSSEDDANQTLLHHKVPIEIMERLYKTHDWKEFTNDKPEGFVEVKGVKIPFVTVWNIPETHDFKELESRYSPPLKKLWDMYLKNLSV